MSTWVPVQKNHGAALCGLTTSGRVVPIRKLVESPAAPPPAPPPAPIRKHQESPPVTTQPTSRRDVEAQLDALAKARAHNTGESFAGAYSEILKTRDGIRLYRQFEAAEPEPAAVPAPAVTAKSAAAAAVEKQLDILARSHAAKHGVTYAQAYDQVLKTDHGKALYTAYVAA